MLTFSQNVSKDEILRGHTGDATFILESFSEISTNFFENFLKNLVKISIKLYFRIAQILLVVYPNFTENFLFFPEFPQISIKTLSHQHLQN